MAPAGMAKFRIAGKPQGITSRTKTPDPHPDFVKTLQALLKAREYFERLIFRLTSIQGGALIR